jgi:hypothetical protein
MACTGQTGRCSTSSSILRKRRWRSGTGVLICGDRG